MEGNITHFWSRWVENILPDGRRAIRIRRDARDFAKHYVKFCNETGWPQEQEVNMDMLEEWVKHGGSDIAKQIRSGYVDKVVAEFKKIHIEIARMLKDKANSLKQENILQLHILNELVLLEQQVESTLNETVDESLKEKYREVLIELRNEMAVQRKFVQEVLGADVLRKQEGQIFKIQNIDVASLAQVEKKDAQIEKKYIRGERREFKHLESFLARRKKTPIPPEKFSKAMKEFLADCKEVDAKEGNEVKNDFLLLIVLYREMRILDRLIKFLENSGLPRGAVEALDAQMKKEHEAIDETVSKELNDGRLLDSIIERTT